MKSIIPKRRQLDARRVPKRECSEETMRCILEGAARVLVEVGWEKFSTRRVSLSAGVGTGTLYLYFPNREALMRALVHKIWSDELAALALEAAAPEATLPSLAVTFTNYVALQIPFYSEWYTYVTSFAAADAGPWDARALEMLGAVFDRTHRDEDGRKDDAVDLIFALVTHGARRAALANPEALRSGRIAEELRLLVQAYLATFPTALPRLTP